MPEIAILARSDRFEDINRIRFTEEASVGHDRFDTERLMPLDGNYLMMPMLGENGRTYTTLSYPSLDEVIEIPVGIEFTKSGTVDLEVTQFDLPQGYTIEFVDYQANVRLPLSADFTYSFEHQANAKVRPVDEIIPGFGNVAASDNNRFALVIAPPTTTSAGVQSDLPTEVSLSQNFPNPFNPTTSIRYQVPENTHVRLGVYDLLGRQVALLVNDTMPAGSHTAQFDASSLSSGVYIYRIEAAGQSQSRRMTLVK